MGLLDGIIGSVGSISGSAVAVDGVLRTQLGPIYSQISAMLDGVGADGIMRATDMQNLLNVMQALPQQGAAAAADSTAKQAKILMMLVEINALKVQLQKLEDDLEELQRDATGPNLGSVHRVRRDVNSIPSGSAEDKMTAQRLAEQQSEMFQLLSKMLTQSQDMSKSAINNMGR